MIGFTGSRLDRADHLRGDPAAVAELARRPDARCLLLDGLEPRLDEQDRLGWGLIDQDATLAFLGLLDRAPRFVALVPGIDASSRGDGLFAMIDRLPAEEAATYAAARSLVGWHARHRFCANCGHDTAPFRAGWGRACPACTAEHYPRTDPVVIMLAEHGGRVLVGRQHRFPPGRYSALAGFVEVGESLEEAVARELLEEAGVRATDVRYLFSQPWPFPSQLMLACMAQVADDHLRIDPTELEDAFWVTRAEVSAALAGAADARFIPPPPYAIAHSLLAAWAQR